MVTVAMEALASQPILRSKLQATEGHWFKIHEWHRVHDRWGCPLVSTWLHTCVHLHIHKCTHTQVKTHVSTYKNIFNKYIWEGICILNAHIINFITQITGIVFIVLLLRKHLDKSLGDLIVYMGQNTHNQNKHLNILNVALKCIRKSFFQIIKLAGRKGKQKSKYSADTPDGSTRWDVCAP